MRLQVRPGVPLSGEATVPGDKSIAHRLLILATVGEGPSRLTGLPAGHDVRSTATCMLRLSGHPQPGIEAWLGIDAPDELEIDGRGYAGLAEPRTSIDCGNSGTTMRLLAGLVAGRPMFCMLDGDDSLRRRPMERVAEPLRSMGADVRTSDGQPPVMVEGASLRGTRLTPAVPSAQVKGAILLAAMQSTGTTEVVETARTRDHTERLLRALGAPVEIDGSTVRARSHQHEGFDAHVPGDPSSAAFLLAAGAARSGGSVSVDGVGTNPSRTAFLDVFARAGVKVDVTEIQGSLDEPVGTMRLADGRLTPFDVGPDELPTVIDEVPVLAALAALADGTSRFEGAGELRVKESDRLAGLEAGLVALGGRARIEGDSLVVEGGRLAGGVADAGGDHRLAMAFAVAALGAEGPSVVEGAEWAAVSFPGFAPALAALGADVSEVR